MPPGGRIWMLLACGLCALAAAGTIAFAAPARRSAHPGRPTRPRRARSHRARSHRARPRSCATRARTRHARHHGASCRPRTRSHGGKPAGATHSTGTKGAGGATGGAGEPAAGSQSGSEGAGGGSGAGGSGPPPSVPRVEVTAVEFHYTLSRTSVPAGKVIFDFVNHGQDEHNLNVQPGEGPVAGAFANTPSEGMSEQAMVLRAGTYTLFCSLPEHESKGMKATLVVE